MEAKCIPQYCAEIQLDNKFQEALKCAVLEKKNTMGLTDGATDS